MLSAVYDEAALAAAPRLRRPFPLVVSGFSATLIGHRRAPSQSLVEPFEVVLVVVLDRDSTALARGVDRHFGRQRIAQ